MATVQFSATAPVTFYQEDEALDHSRPAAVEQDGGFTTVGRGGRAKPSASSSAASGASSSSTRGGRGGSKRGGGAAAVSSSVSSSSAGQAREHAPADGITESVRVFVSELQRSLAERSLGELRTLYEDSFTRLSERLFKGRRWPTPEVVEKQLRDPSVASGELFMMLYKELYYRHIVATFRFHTPQESIEAWANYIALFDFVLSSASAPTEEEMEWVLPQQWVWDIIDEFVYQFQSLYTARTRAEQRTASAAQGAWTIQRVLEYLQRLAVPVAATTTTATAGSLRPTFASFAVIGVCRVQVLLCDYVAAIQALVGGNVDLQRKGVYAQVTSCHVTLYYYLGFSYLMLGRYADATKTLSSILGFLGRSRPQQQQQLHSQRGYQLEEVTKKTEQMYALLAMSLALCPQRTDEYVHGQLREKYGDKTPRLNQGDTQVFEELFNFAAPKFILPFGDASFEPLKVQRDLFIREIQQQEQLSTIRSYLRLYTSTTLEKLAGFLECKDTPEVIRKKLICYRHKSRAVTWQRATEEQPAHWYATDADFVLEGNMVHVREAKPSHRYTDFFIRAITKLDALH